MCTKGIDFASFYDFSTGLWNCSDSVALFVFLCDFGTVPTVWHYLFFYVIWNFPTVWHYLFFYWTLELFRQCGIICFPIGHWNCSGSVALLFVFVIVPTVFFYVTLELFRQCGIICFSIGLWNFPTVWHYLFSYWTLELFRQCGIICFSM